jgi:transcriptional regulator with XRE-family HTH domain
VDRGDAIDLTALGRAIARKRRESDWSAHRLAKRAGVADPYLRRIEDGNATPGIDVLARISHALGLSLTRLFEEAGLGALSATTELEATYSALTPPDQYALLHIGRALREARERYGTEEVKGEEPQSEEPQSLEADPLTPDEFEQGRRQGKLAADPLRDADRPESDEPA